MSEDDKTILASLAAGARGYLLKTAGREEITAAVRAVACGGSVLSPRIAGRRAALAGATAGLTDVPVSVSLVHPDRAGRAGRVLGERLVPQRCAGEPVPDKYAPGCRAGHCRTVLPSEPRARVPSRRR